VPARIYCEPPDPANPMLVWPTANTIGCSLSPRRQTRSSRERDETTHTRTTEHSSNQSTYGRLRRQNLPFVHRGTELVIPDLRRRAAWTILDKEHNLTVAHPYGHTHPTHLPTRYNGVKASRQPAPAQNKRFHAART